MLEIIIQGRGGQGAQTAGNLLAEEGLAELLARNRGVGGPALLEALNWDLSRYHGGDSFPDDLSMVLYEFAGGAVT